MTASFQDLVQIYKRTEFKNDAEDGKFSIQNQDDIALLEELSSQENVELTGLYIDENNLNVGSEVRISIDGLSFKLGRIFSQFKEFVLGDMAQISQPNIINSPYYIISEKVASFDSNLPKKLLSYRLVKELILQLMNANLYTDNVNRKLIFFSKRTFELSNNVEDIIGKFISVLAEMDQNKYLHIEEFIRWLSNKETSEHSGEKKYILAYVLLEILPNGANIIDIIQKIEQIDEAVQSQYGLYLENFSYSKFVKKLEENNEKFVTRINDTISKILPQLLGLPFLAAIITAFRAEDNLFVYSALFVYSLVSILALGYQKTILDDISDEINTYDKNGNVPEELKRRWIEYKFRFDKLVRKQKTLYYVLYISALICLLYSLYKGYNIDYLKNTILNKIEYLYSLILNLFNSLLYNIELSWKAS